jgi:hypothetical protein
LKEFLVQAQGWVKNKVLAAWMVGFFRWLFGRAADWKLRLMRDCTFHLVAGMSGAIEKYAISKEFSRTSHYIP